MPAGGDPRTMAVHFEDLRVGERVSLGTQTADRAEMVAFAERYDPQAFHVESDAESPFGGLVASGWYTAALCMRAFVEEFLSGAATAGAKGVDELRWPAPVRPGDELSVSLSVADTEPRGDGRGLARCRVTAENGDGETVCSMVGLVLFARR